METYNPQKNQEETFARIKSEIEKMKANRISKEEFDTDLARDKVLSQKGDSRTPEENSEKDFLRNKFKEHGVFLKTLPELQYALRCLNYFDDKKIEGIVSHENAHANKIESLGIDFVGYRIISFITKDGREEETILAQRGDYPTEWTRQEELEAFKSIAQAPEEYESKEPLSGGDKDMIDRANNELLK